MRLLFLKTKRQKSGTLLPSTPCCLSLFGTEKKNSKHSSSGRLPTEARAAFLADAVAAGQAAWLDSSAETGDSNKTNPKRALIFWRPLSEWGELLLAWARDSGLSGGNATVLTLDELDSGSGDATGCPLSGTHRELVRAAAKWLAEVKKAVALFGGGSGGNDNASEGEDVGVKFL